jgi:non-histone protein 10
MTANVAQPKEKPLRTKRGHRKPSFLTNLDATPGRAGFLSNNQAIAPSPSNSDAFSHTHTAPRVAVPSTNGTIPPTAAETPRRPQNAFELFASETRAAVQGGNNENGDIDRQLARMWREMGDSDQKRYFHRFDTGNFSFSEAQTMGGQGRQDDVEMGEDGDEDDSMYG